MAQASIEGVDQQHALVNTQFHLRALGNLSKPFLASFVGKLQDREMSNPPGQFKLQIQTGKPAVRVC